MGELTDWLSTSGGLARGFHGMPWAYLAISADSSTSSSSGIHGGAIGRPYLAGRCRGCCASRARSF